MLETFQKTKRGEILSECEYRNPSFPEKLQLLERPILLVGTMHIIDLPWMTSQQFSHYMGIYPNNNSFSNKIRTI